MTRRLVAAFAFVLMSAAPALAVGPVVGTNCVISWSPVTTNVDGTPITGALTYDVWQVRGLQTTVGVPPTLTGVTTTSITPGCPVAGQFTAFVDAFANGLDSVDSIAFPYMVVIPNAPATFTVNALGQATWAPVTTYTDNTPIVGLVSYELWVTPAAAVAPSGPPLMTVTTTSATLTGTAGANKAFIKAMTTPTPGVGNSTSESAALASPFAVSPAPATPINLNVR